MKGILAILGLLLSPVSLYAAEKIDLLPPSGYDRSAIYFNLLFFWIGVIVLIVLIKWKLREIERVQAMEAQEEGEKIPMLE